MARNRREDDDDEVESSEDYEIRPRRRRPPDDYEEYDRPRRRRKKLTGFDGMFANTSLAALVLFGLCCGDIALILGIIGLAVCQDDTARRNATIVTILSAVRVGVVVILIITGKLALPG